MKKCFPVGLFVVVGLLSAEDCPAIRFRSQEKTPADKHIRGWVQDLDSDSTRVRDEAIKQLIAAGKSAFDPISQAAEGKNLNVAGYAIGILIKWSRGPDPEIAALASAALDRLAESPNAIVAAAVITHIGSREQRIAAKLEKIGANVELHGGKIIGVGLREMRGTDAVLELVGQLSDVVHLDLFLSDLTDAGLKHLRGMHSLRRVAMGGTKITDAGLEHLEGLTELEYVGLRADNVTDAGLARLQKLTALTELTLSESKVTDVGLARLKGLTKMDYLRIDQTAITDVGLKHLHVMTQLKRLDIGGCKTTPQGQARLHEVLPEVQINLDYAPLKR
jgi:hypothetical protein